MRKRSPILEWQIAESEAEWEALQAHTTPDPPRRTQPYRWAGVVVLLLIMGVGGWWARSTPADPAQADGAQRPPLIIWGAQERLTTKHFIFHFYQRDVQTVATVAPQVDQFYTMIQQDFGIAAVATPLHITVSITRTLESAPYRPRSFEMLTVPSPLLYPANEWREADLLTQSITLLLIDHALAQVVRRHGIGAARYPLLDGLRLWQLWERDLPLAHWQPDLLHWLYIELPTATPEQALPLPAHYAAFCATHTLWMPHPAQLRIPLLCTPLDESPARLPRASLGQPPRHLPRLDTPVYPDEEVDAQGKTTSTRHPGDAIAFATLVDHIVQAYGRDWLPVFVAALGLYATWDELTPAVFGVSAETLEANWQRSLP